MKRKNMWLILTEAVALSAMMTWLPQNSVLAAEEDEQLQTASMDYMDPFDLTVTPYTMSPYASSNTAQPSQAVPAVSTAAPAAPAAPAPSTLDTIILAGAPTVYRVPPMIWIPYRPTFRSPCMPHY